MPMLWILKRILTILKKNRLYDKKGRLDKSNFNF